jgi:hypothetical protein
MEAYAGTKLTTTVGKITAVLAAVFLAVLSTGAAAQTGGPPPTAAGGRVSAIPKAVTPITIEITQGGDIVKATDANGALLPTRDPSTATQTYFTKGKKHYLFGTGMITNPANRSVRISASCLQEEGKSWRCWPGDRSVRIKLDRRGIRNLWYLSDGGKSAHTRPPVGGPPTPAPGKDYWFGQLPQAALKQYPGVQLLDATGCVCCCCFAGICYDGPPCT